jgi:hypothetical protein
MRSGASTRLHITLGAPQRTSLVVHNAAPDQSGQDQVDITQIERRVLTRPGS